MNKKYFFLLWIVMSSIAISAQVFTKMHTPLKGVIQPVMSWLDVNNNYPDVFLDGDYYVNTKHFVISQLSALQQNQRFALLHSPFPALYRGDAAAADYDKDGDMDLLVAGMAVCYDFIGQVYRNNLNPKIEKAKTNIVQPIPNYNHGPYYYYVFSSCYCDPIGENNPKYHLYISNIHKEKFAYNLNYKFNELLIKNVPNWGKADRGHRTSNAFVTRKEAEASRVQVIESYKAKGFEVHFFNW